jgi:cellulose biosynthesis protein BcsQ
MKRIAFFSNIGGVGQTTLVYHLAHMMVEGGQRVLLLDFDPQSHLTALCIPEEDLEEIWRDQSPSKHATTIFDCVHPLIEGNGDIQAPQVKDLREGLAIVPGDVRFSAFEEALSDAWARAPGREEHAFRILSALHRVAGMAAQRHQADVVLVDVGRNLGAISRAALLAADFVVTPVAPDFFSRLSLRHLGLALIHWRQDWQDRRSRSPDPQLDLPAGRMQPLGYVVMQAAMRLSHPVTGYEKWVARISGEYHRSILCDPALPPALQEDPWCLGIMRHYQSLVPLARDAHKPMFDLRPADGAIGAHMDAVLRCREDFERLSKALLARAAALGAPP